MNAKSFLFLIFIFFFKSVCCNSYGQSKTDSLLSIIELKKYDTSMVNTLAILSKEYYLNMPEKAILYAEKGLALAEKLGYKKGMARCLKSIGNVYYSLSNFEKALEDYRKSIIIYFEIGDKSGYAFCLNNIGNVYVIQNNYPMAMMYYQKSVKIFEAIEDKKGMASCYNNLGNIYYLQSNFDKAIEYYQKSVNIYIETGDNNSLLIYYNNIGKIKIEQKKYSLAIEYYLRSLKIAEKIGDRKAESRCYNNIGDAQRDQGKYATAFENYKKSLKILEEFGDKQGMVEIYVNLSILNNSQKNYPTAIEYAEKVLALAKETGSLALEQSAHESLSNSYKGLENYKEALKQYELFKKLNDSIYNIGKHNQIAKMETIFQNEKKQKEIEIQKLKISQQDLKLDHNRMWLTILTLSISLIIIFFAGFFLYYKIKQRSKHKTEMLRQQEIRTNAIIETQEEERKRIAQDLHDGIGHKLTTIKINFEKIKEFMQAVLPEKKIIFEQTVNILDETHKEVRTLSHQMMPKALQEKELTYAVSDLLEQTFTNSKIKCRLINEAPNDLPVNIGICIYRVLQELLNNILKHAQATEISVQIFKNKNVLIMMVEDDGIGFLQNDGLIQGIGLNNIAGRIHALLGTFIIEPGPVKGTIATVRIPLSPSVNNKG